MRKLITLLLLMVGLSSYGQLQVEAGYLVNDNYSKGYLSLGDRFGGLIAVGGDARISVAGEDEGYGYIDLAGWYDVISEREDLSLKLIAGGSSKQEYEKYQGGRGYVDPNNGKPQHVGSTIRPFAGLSVSYKWAVGTINSLGEVGVGFKLKR